MLKLKKFSIYILKGTLIGIGAIIPGISGGTISIIVGCFEDIIYHLGNFSKHLVKSVSYLFPLVFGAGFGMYIFSPILISFCNSFPLLSKYTFCLLSAISLLMFCKKINNLEVSIRNISFTLFGVIVSAIFTLAADLIKTDIGITSFYGLFLISLPLSVALVLPAVSFSQMLLFFGIYEKTLLAVQTLDYIFLFPIIFGVVTGTILLSKLLSTLLQKFKTESYSFVLGFVIMSLIETIAS